LQIHLITGLLLLLLMLTGCRQPQAPLNNPDVQIDITTMPDPPTLGDARLFVQVSDAQGSPIDDAQLEVRGDMTHAGMVPVLRSITGGENGMYEVPFEWTMGGDWFVEITATLPDGTTGRAIFNYTLAESSTE
jgi:hypothetical protein